MEWDKEILLAHMASRGTQQRSKYAGSVISARAVVQDGNHRPSRYPQAFDRISECLPSELLAPQLFRGFDE